MRCYKWVIHNSSSAFFLSSVISWRCFIKAFAKDYYISWQGWSIISCSRGAHFNVYFHLWRFWIWWIGGSGFGHGKLLLYNTVTVSKICQLQEGMKFLYKLCSEWIHSEMFRGSKSVSLYSHMVWWDFWDKEKRDLYVDNMIFSHLLEKLPFLK